MMRFPSKLLPFPVHFARGGAVLGGYVKGGSQLPPKLEPPRAKCAGEGYNLLGKRISLNESEQTTLKTK